MDIKLLALATTFPYILAGCNMLTNYKELEANKRLAIVTEIKQDIGDGNFHEFKVTCPEASPDALMMLAGSLSGETKSGVALAAAFSESGSNIGLRTHSIQLLRDQLFSICQAYANQGLTAYTYQTLLSRNQQNTIALMAIEQLTGVLKSPQVSIATNANAGTSQLLKLETDIIEKKEKLAGIGDQASTEAAELKKEIAALENKRTTMNNIAASSGGKVEIKLPDSTSQGLTSQNVKVITDAVIELVEITNRSTDTPNTFMVCTDVLQSTSYLAKVRIASEKSITQYTPLESACKEFVTQTISTNANIAKVISSEAKELSEKPRNANTVDSSIQKINSLQQLIK